jgi:hypothetical protein
MELLGSIQRKELKRALEDQFTERRRLEYTAANTSAPPLQALSTTRHKDSPRHSNVSGDTKDILASLWCSRLQFRSRMSHSAESVLYICMQSINSKLDTVLQRRWTSLSQCNQLTAMLSRILTLKYRARNAPILHFHESQDLAAGNPKMVLKTAVNENS